MIGFQSPASALELAKLIRADDIAAAERYRLRRLTRQAARETHRSAARPDAAVATPRAPRPAASGRVESSGQPSG